MNLSDINLWNWFKQAITPLGEPKRPSLPSPSATFARKIDLHGLTAQDAFDTTIAYIETARKQGTPSVVVVTGKSGVMRNEFFHWVEGNDNITRCELLPSDGAFRIIFRK